jgi:ABC-2 type transport system ATP-binding protein
VSAALTTRRLGKRYGRTWALRGCSIRLPAGRVAALVGPNGAGKTTLLHLAVGLLQPTEGEVELFGWSPADDPDLVLAQVGFVAQEAPLYDSFSVADMLHLGRTLNRRWDQGVAEARLRRAGVALDRRVGRLSGGQRAQVALALALGKKPELLLLDEPLASLDPLARQEFLQQLMDAVTADGLTVVLSSHLIGELERVCDYLVLLNRGSVQVAGDIEELTSEHHLLVGPARADAACPPGLAVIKQASSERQVTLWVRGRPGALPPGWTASPLALEQLVLAYMASPDACSFPPELEAITS